METEQGDREVVEAFRQTYQRLVERAPVSQPDWPPVLVAQSAPTHRYPQGWLVTVIVFLITVAFGLGWVVSPGQAAGDSDPFQVQTGTTIPATPEVSGVTYPSPFDAAVAYAEAQNPDVEDPRVTRIVGIYADQSLVDLRVQVQADDFCHWYGVTGRVDEGELAWQGGPALPCDD